MHQRPDRPPLLEDVLYGDAPFQVPAPPTSLPVVSLSDFVPFFDKIHTQVRCMQGSLARGSFPMGGNAGWYTECWPRARCECDAVVGGCEQCPCPQTVLRQSSSCACVPWLAVALPCLLVLNPCSCHAQDFFNPTFALNAPEAFERYLCVPASLAQQNKLSNYLDLVEVDLLQTIGERSDDFFHALSTFQELQNVVTMAVNDIGHLRCVPWRLCTFVCHGAALIPLLVPGSGFGASSKSSPAVRCKCLPGSAATWR